MNTTFLLKIFWFVFEFIAICFTLFVFFAVVREGIRFWKRRRWEKKKEECLKLIREVEKIQSEEIVPLALYLKKSFPLPVIESVLDHYAKQPTHKEKIVDIYDQLGFIDLQLKKLKEGKRWSDRAQAAEKLGSIGHAKAVLPLFEVVHDATEDREVKNVAIHSLGKIHDKRAIPLFIEELANPEQAANYVVADILAEFGEGAIDELVRMLSLSHLEPQRYWGVYTLGKIQSRKALLPLIHALSDRSARVRAEAVKGLGVQGGPEVISPLSEALASDPHPLVRDAAAKALGKIGNEASLTSLTAALADPNTETRFHSLESLEKMGKKAVPFLLETLKHGTPQASFQAACALERMGFVASEIEKLSGSEKPSALENLHSIATRGVIEVLTSSLKHLNFKIRISLCSILEKAPQNRKYDGLAYLAQNDNEWAVRLAALSSLAKLADPRSLPLFASALENEIEPVVKEGILSSLKSAPISFIQELKNPISQLLQDENTFIRISSAEVLAHLLDPTLVPLFVNALSDPNPVMRKKAAESLGRLKSPEAVLPLIDRLTDSSLEVRLAAVRSLGLIKDLRAIKPIAQSFGWSDVESREEIAIALASLPENYQVLTDLMMGLESPKARAGVIWTLTLLKDPQKKSLIEKFLHDSDHTVRAIAAAGLGSFGFFSGEIKALLLEGLKDPNEFVRAAAVRVLGQSEDISALEKLISLLAEEKDPAVCQEIALAIGCLNDPKKQEEAISSIKKWIEKSPKENNRASAFIALALLQDEDSFSTIFSAVLLPSSYSSISKLLNRLEKKHQSRFFSFLSLDPHNFYPQEAKLSWEHYKDILQSDHDSTQRVRAIQALVILKEKAALPYLDISFEKDPSPKVRATALSAMSVFLESGELLNLVYKAALDSAKEVRMQAATILEHLDVRNKKMEKKSLFLLLDVPDKQIQKQGARILFELYRHNWKPLVDQLMGAEKKTTVFGLLEVCGEIKDPAISSLLKRFLQNNDPQIRKKSAEIAFDAGMLTQKEWREFLEDPDETVRLFAIHEVGKIIDDESVKVLADHLEDPSWEIRKELALLFGKQKNTRFLGLLKKLSDDSHPIVCIISLISLFYLGEKTLIKGALALFSALNPTERDLLLFELHARGFFDESLIILRQDKDPSNRKEALELLAALDLDHFSHEIAQYLQDQESEVRLAALKALEGKTIQPGMIKSLKNDPVKEIRAEAKRKFGDPKT